MDRIFNIPKSIIERSQIDEFWIDTNDAMVGMSEIKFDKDYCWVPWHIYEDSLADHDEINNKSIEKDYWTLYPLNLFSEIQRIRRESYRACIWYKEICNNIPTSKSVMIRINDSCKREDIIKSALEDNLNAYPFVRLCTMSPKDVKFVPLYEKVEDAAKDLAISERTKNGCHLFLREKKEYEIEARCFWSRDKLRAVSISILDIDMDDKNDALKSIIIKFFEKYKKFIPYHSAIIDIGIIYSGSESGHTLSDADKWVELIEFNSFGPDMNATSGNFSWYEDILTLLFSKEPVFRYLNS